MSDDGAEKRFAPTQSRRERAKREGQTARSHEAAGAVAFVAALGGLLGVLPFAGATAATAVRAAAHAERIDAGPAGALVAFALVPALAAALGATAATVVQSGGLHLNAPSFALGKLAPWPGFKRMFGAEAAIGATRALVAFAVVIAVVMPIAMRAIGAATQSASVASTASIVWAAIVQACFSAAGAGALFAFADYALVRRRWLQSLKMTFDEMKRDAKEQDGDPQSKSRRKHLHRSLTRGGIARVGEASFVIANPTHIAIAIRYAPPAVAVPEIVCRAADAAALEVRALAERYGIPVLPDIQLARLLWRIGEAGRPIPPETFVPVAMIIAALLRTGALSR